MKQLATNLLRDFHNEVVSKRGSAERPKYQKGDVRTERVTVTASSKEELRDKVKDKIEEVVTPNSNALPTQGGY